MKPHFLLYYMQLKTTNVEDWKSKLGFLARK